MSNSMDLHIFFFPFFVPGHVIPMVDMAKLFAVRGIKATIVTTDAYAPRIQPSLDRSSQPVNLLTLPMSSSSTATAEIFTPEVIAGLDLLKAPFERLLIDHHPDCIVSDVMYPLSASLAVEHGIPRIEFGGSSIFSRVVYRAIYMFKPQDSVADEAEYFVVPGLPHHIEMLRSQLMDASLAPVLDAVARNVEARKFTYGSIMNTFCEMEPGYWLTGEKSWVIGPLALCNRDMLDRAARGGEEIDDEVMHWLDSKDPGSVLYVCFGSLGQFSGPQLSEIAKGLKSSGHWFIWLVKNSGDGSEWMVEGIEEKGLVVRGWAPQMVILNHAAVGGFVTHCGWNSCLEGASAGLPMITWPLVSDQFLNGRLLVDVLRIGVPVGSKVCTQLEEKRSWISVAKVEEVVKEGMGSGDEAKKRRKRAKELSEMAKVVVVEGGSSYNDLGNLIQELKEVKAAKFDPVTVI